MGSGTEEGGAGAVELCGASTPAKFGRGSMVEFGGGGGGAIKGGMFARRAPGACPARYLCIKYLISSPKFILT